MKGIPSSLRDPSSSTDNTWPTLLGLLVGWTVPKLCTTDPPLSLSGALWWAWSLPKIFSWTTMETLPCRIPMRPSTISKKHRIDFRFDPHVRTIQNMPGNLPRTSRMQSISLRISHPHFQTKHRLRHLSCPNPTYLPTMRPSLGWNAS